MFYFYNSKLLILFDVCKYSAHIYICINIVYTKIPDKILADSTGQSI